VTRLLLDTSALSALFVGRAEAVEAIREAGEIAVNPVVIGEVLAGWRKTGGRYERDLRDFLEGPRVRVVDITETTGQHYAVIVEALRKAGTPVPTNDVWIAASAMEHGLTVLTADRHFGRIGQILSRILAA
jgi:predicted nucleic acid-binding protein